MTIVTCTLNQRLFYV